MKHIHFLLFGAVLLLLCGAVAAQQERFESIVSVELDSFDGAASNWTVRGSTNIDNRYLDSRVVDAWPRTLYGENPVLPRRALGVRGGFVQRGYNYIEIVPNAGFVVLPGQARELELWVWNTNRDYYITAQLQDYRGLYHSIELGGINHLGWKKLSGRIPPSLIQRRAQAPGEDDLRLLKLVLWTRPSSNVSEFRVYFDELRVVTDVYRPYFDGSDLANQNKIDEIWGGAQ